MRLALAFSRSASACSSAPLNNAGSISAITSPLCTRELKSALSFAMVPETCDPTWTVMTALIVPVASTTSLISPRSTFAVKCCAGVFRFRAQDGNNPASHDHGYQDEPRTSLSSCPHLENDPDASLVPQRFYRIQQRRLARRVISEKHSDGDRKHRRDEHRLNRHFHRPM